MRLILAIAVIVIIVRLCTWDSLPRCRGLWFGPYWYTPMPRWPRGPRGPVDPDAFRHGPGPGPGGFGPGGFGGHGPSGFGGGGHGFGGGGRR